MDKERYMNGLRANLKVDNAVGFEQAITTLTQIVDGVQRQKLYESGVFLHRLVFCHFCFRTVF